MLGYIDINHHHLDKHIKNDFVRSVLEKVVNALNTDNHNNSDIMTDYFDVGHYIDLQFGNIDKPYLVKK